MTQLLNIDWYRGFIQGKQMVMIGYSDSAKDAGVMAASWAQYRAQEALVNVCEKAGVALTLSTDAVVQLVAVAHQHTQLSYHNRREA
jgi:phosphoenolpyruvate carboxylase